MNNPIVILILLIAFFGLIALIVFLIQKFVPGLKDKDQATMSEEQQVKEELDRVLVALPEENKEETTPVDEPVTAEEKTDVQPTDEQK